MKLEVAERNDQHKEMVTAVCWTPANELLACSDDKSISRWSSDGEPVTPKVATQLPYYVTDIHYYTSPSTAATGGMKPSGGGGGGAGSDLFAVCCSDGTFRLMTRAGREEKKVDAHSGAVTRIRWNLDGTALVTAGEEGDIKVWSRSGNLRSTLAQTGKPVYALAWGPDNDQVVATNDKDLFIKAVQQAGRKQVQWKAHDGVVLCVDWNLVNGLMVSGGEDCTYRVWDAFGRQMYQSQPLENVVTSVAWRPNGENFAVGAFNTLRLCDRLGWSYSRERPQCGSVLNIAWTPDGTQLAGAGGNGAVVFGQLTKRSLEWNETEAVLVEPKKIRVQDLTLDAYEDLDFRDRVIEFALAYGRLVVATTTQAYVYSAASGWHTPHILDLRQGAAVSLVLLSQSHFLLLDSVTGVSIYTYEGRPLSQPKFPGLKPDCLSRSTISLAPDTVAVVDHSDGKTIRVFDVTTGKQVSSNITHQHEISELALSVYGSGLPDRRLAFVDKSRELWITPVVPLQGYHSYGANNQSQNTARIKLHTQVDSIRWSDRSDVLAALADGRLHTWLYPSVVYVDKDLLLHTRLTQDFDANAGPGGAGGLGIHPQIMTFNGPRLTIRRALDGALLTRSIPVYPLVLYDLLYGGNTARWEEAIKLCRFVKSDPLWACLAAMAINGKSLETAEIALAALCFVDKLEFVLHLMSIPSDEGRSAELAMYKRCPEEAERILLQASPPLLYRAIKLNIRLFRWQRALELAVTHRTHVDTVLGYRHRYLQSMNRTETDPRFIQYAQQVKVDWEAVEAKKAKEREDERSRASRGTRK